MALASPLGLAVVLALEDGHPRARATQLSPTPQSGAIQITP
jgi:hypothetical protein